MGNYNPHRPSILGQEWTPIKEMPYTFDIETERGYTFVLDHVATVVSGAVYIDDVPANSNNNKGVMMAVYEAGTEHLTGPIQRVVVPPVSGFWRSDDSGNPSSVAITPSNSTIAAALTTPNDGGVVFIQEDTRLYVQFDTSTVFAQLTGKRILGINVLYVMGGTQTGVPGPDEGLFVSHDLFVSKGDVDGNDRTYDLGTPTVNLTTGLAPEITRQSLGNSQIYDLLQNCTSTPSMFGSLFWPIRDADLLLFDTGVAAANQTLIEFRQDDGCNGCPSIFLPANQYSYAALEIFYAEEKRLLVGGRGVYTCSQWALNPGQNRIMLKPTNTFAVTGRVLQPGEYTVTATMADMGDSFNNEGGNYTATALLQKYALPTHTGVVVDTRVAEGKTFQRATSDILPRITLHTSSGVVTGVHDYDYMTPGTVYGGVDVGPDVVQRSGGAAVSYPQVRFYARRFGETSVPLVLSRVSTPTQRVSITADELDALPEIVDGWREVTLRFADSVVPTFSDTGVVSTWEWSADGLEANNQWEVLVPYGPTTTSGPFNATAATYGGGAALTIVGADTLSSSADATLIFSQDPPAVTGFAVSTEEQELEAIGDECLVDQKCVPTGLYYNRVTWNARDVGDLFDDRTAASGWGTAPSRQVWSTFNGTIDDFFVVSGSGRITVDTVNTLYTALIESRAINVEVYGRFKLPLVPSGGSVTARLAGRAEDSGNFYEAVLTIDTAGVVTILTDKRIGGTSTTISPTITLDGTHVANDVWNIVLRCQADQILAKAWKDNHPVPLAWQAVGRTLPGDGLIRTRAGALVRAEAGFSGGTFVAEWLEFSTTDLDVPTFELQRRDEIDDEWQTIMLSSNTSVHEFLDYEARVGEQSEYRIRTVNVLGFNGPWTSGIPTVLDLPGGSGNYVSSPDTASLDITGDIDLRAKIAPDDWTPSADMCIVSKSNTTGNQRGYQLVLRSTGALRFTWSTDGTGAGTTDRDSTAVVGFTDGTPHWVRVTLTAATGIVKFYTSEDGVTWTQLGVSTASGATSIFANTATVNVGARSAGTADLFTGLTYRVEIRNGIDGTIVANPQFDEQSLGTTSFTDSTGKVWTLNGTAVITSNPIVTPGSATLPVPGVIGAEDGNSVLIFTTNEVQDGSANLAYTMTWSGDVSEEFAFPEAGTVQLRDVFRRDFPIAFRPLERGGERFSRDIIVQNAAVSSELERDGFRSLRDLAWEDVSYICVRNELGDRWLANVSVPNGKVSRNRRLYIARIDIAEVSDTPSQVDPVA